MNKKYLYYGGAALLAYFLFFRKKKAAAKNTAAVLENTGATPPVSGSRLFGLDIPLPGLKIDKIGTYDPLGLFNNVEEQISGYQTVGDLIDPYGKGEAA